jgi:hypothetical protein
MLNKKCANLSPEEEHKSVDCIWTLPAMPELADQETLGRKAI